MTDLNELVVLTPAERDLLLQAAFAPGLVTSGIDVPENVDVLLTAVQSRIRAHVADALEWAAADLLYDHPKTTTDGWSELGDCQERLLRRANEVRRG